MEIVEIKAEKELLKEGDVFYSISGCFWVVKDLLSSKYRVISIPDGNIGRKEYDSIESVTSFFYDIKIAKSAKLHILA